MAKRRFLQFSIRLLLILPVIVLAALVTLSPYRHAVRIVELIENAKPAWEQEYLNEEVWQVLNDKIPGIDSDIPDCTFSFKSRIVPRTFIDVCLLRQPIEIEFTSNPPEYEGPITRHRVTFDVGVTKMHQKTESKKILHWYFE